MSSGNKIEEANNFVKKAEKSLKTSFMKWSPDYDSAISYYSSAVDSFKAGGDLENAINILMKVSELHEKNHSIFYAAKAQESAADICLNQGNIERGMQLILEAGSQLRVNGTASAACQMMQRIGKKLEQTHPGAAGRLYRFSAEAAQDTDNVREASEYAGLAAKMLARESSASSAEVVAALRDKMRLASAAGVNHEASKALIAAIIVILHRDNDIVAATKLYEEMSGSMLDNDDSDPLRQLLQAYNNGDGEVIQRILRSGTFLYLENDYAKLARDLANSQKVEEKPATKAEGDQGSQPQDDGDDIN